jgi:DNA-directed RNA polymerase, mitochondrial
MPVNVPSRSPVDLVRMAMARDIPLVSLVPACGVVAGNEQEQDELLRLISRTVAAMGYPKLVHELGQAVEEVDVLQAPDHLKDVPQVKPVVRLRVSLCSIHHCISMSNHILQPRGQVETEVQFDVDGTVREISPVGDAKEEVYEVPYNLRQLRSSLSKLGATHKALGDDLWARQRLLEQSVYDVAVERLRHEHETLDRLQRSSTLGGKPLRALMWDWHQKLSKRLEDDITVLVQEEAQHRKSFLSA